MPGDGCRPKTSGNRFDHSGAHHEALQDVRHRLVLATLFGLADLATPLTTDGEHPPMAIAVAGATLGLLTLAGVGYAWQGRRGGVTTIIVTRLLSAVTAVPAFFVDGVPAGARIVAAARVVLTIVCVATVAPRLRKPALAPA
jgi:hypothetical protein